MHDRSGRVKIPRDVWVGWCSLRNSTRIALVFTLLHLLHPELSGVGYFWVTDGNQIAPLDLPTPEVTKSFRNCFGIWQNFPQIGENQKTWTLKDGKILKILRGGFRTKVEKDGIVWWGLKIFNSQNLDQSRSWQDRFRFFLRGAFSSKRKVRSTEKRKRQLVL